MSSIARKLYGTEIISFASAHNINNNEVMMHQPQGMI